MKALRAAISALAIGAICGPALAESPIQFWLAQRPIIAAQARAREISIVDAAARRHGVPLNIARAVMKVESGGNCRARSWAGAIGAMQVLPATARAMGIYGSLYVCENSIEAGVRYLRKIADRYSGVFDCAIVSLYNRGIGARPICNEYGKKVMSAGKEL